MLSRLKDTGSRPVAVLAYEGMSLFEIGIVTEAFGLARPELDRPWYDLTICAERPGAVRVIGGAVIEARHGLQTLVTAETVIVPGVADVHGEHSPGLLAALRQAHSAGARMVSICSGAFALAAAGLLDDRRATTHWRYADLLRRHFPRVQVDEGVLYVDDGDVLTSAGSAAGIDLCLHLIRRDHGPSVANLVARRMVVPPHREGGQAQFVEAPLPSSTGDTDDHRISRSMAWAVANLDQAITLETLARQAAMSTRSYLRHFARSTGTSPARWLIGQRIQASLPLLETTSLPIEQVARAVGFASAVSYRPHFARAMRTSPTAYRRAFGTGAPNRTGLAPGSF